MAMISIFISALITCVLSGNGISVHWSTGKGSSSSEVTTTGSAEGTSSGTSSGTTEEGSTTSSTSSGYCESYAWKVETDSYDDPCFGYRYDCCTGDDVDGTDIGDYCYWKDTAWCTTCLEDDDGRDCPACCDSLDHTPSPVTTTSSGFCESYLEKVEKTDFTSNATMEDPCFGYRYSCCSGEDEDGYNISSSCYWKSTVWCTNCADEDDGRECPACCDSYDHTQSTTPSPTMHSAKKWEKLHPDYEGGDGELLWNIYYGDYADDDRFTAFRADQLWDADVIRPMIQMDSKYVRFQEEVDHDHEVKKIKKVIESPNADATTTESGQCEDYGEKVTEGWETSTLARDDPCFGYGYSCCTETYSDYCYWKDTYNCDNCQLDIGYGGCSACCDSYDNTESPTKDPTSVPSEVETTPSPTMHSAKKWETLHPDYEGGDGELLWNIYYGDFADDDQFDAFRADQLWDADVIRPMIQMDSKYLRFQQDATNMTTTTTGECESYWTKVDETDYANGATKDDPCFGYRYSCCTSTDTDGVDISEYCYWKDTTWCTNCADDDDGRDCPACCDSYNNSSPAPTAEVTTTTTQEVETPAPTAHSAKKWSMLHPAYKGGDGELLWNIYYGDFADDDRFDAFRKDQLWDADVIRPMIEMDAKYKRFQLAHQSVGGNSAKSEEQAEAVQLDIWLIFAWLLIMTIAVYAVMAYKKQKTEIKTLNSDETETQQLVGYGSTRK